MAILKLLNLLVLEFLLEKFTYVRDFDFFFNN